MRIFLYIVWFLIPAFFLAMALWAWLEKVGDRQKKENPRDFFAQGMFVLAAVLICVAIDQYALETVLDWFGGMVPLGFAQVLLLPIVLYLAALLFGGSKPIIISKAPRVSDRSSRSRPRAK